MGDGGMDGKVLLPVMVVLTTGFLHLCLRHPSVRYAAPDLDVMESPREARAIPGGETSRWAARQEAPDPYPEAEGAARLGDRLELRDSLGGPAGPAAAGGAPREEAATKAPEASQDGAGSTFARAAEKAAGTPRALGRIVRAAIGHPKVLRALFDNELVVKAYMRRPVVRRNCGSAQALSGYVSDPAGRGRVGEYLADVRLFLGSAEATTAFAGSRLAHELVSCPSVRSLASDPPAARALAASSPELAALASDPRLLVALAENSQAAALLGRFSAGMALQAKARP